MKNILSALFFVLALCSVALADNVEVTEGSGTVMGADDVAGVNLQRMKISIGADNENEGDLDDDGDNRMPIETNRTSQFDGTNTTDLTNTTAVELEASGGAGVRHYIETFVVSNSHATVGTVVQLLTGSTVRAQCPAAPAYGGCVVNFPTPIRGEEDETISCKNVTTNAAVRCTVTGFDAEE